MGSKVKVYVNNGPITRTADPLNNKFAQEMKKTITITLAVLISIAGLSLGVRRWFVGPQRYWGEFVGLPHSRVAEMLGAPRNDSRQDKDYPTSDGYYLWSYWHGTGFILTLTFSNNVVIAQNRGSGNH
jgi:hypothetical protein